MRLHTFGTWAGLLVLFAFYAASFHQPALLMRVTDAHSPRVVVGPPTLEVKTGTQMFLASLLGPAFGNFAFFSNALLFLGSTLLLLRRLREAVICFGLAVLFALQTFQLFVLPYHEDEGGVNVSYLVHPLAGWYCWFGALVLALLLALAHRAADAGEATTPPRPASK